MSTMYTATKHYNNLDSSTKLLSNASFKRNVEKNNSSKKNLLGIQKKIKAQDMLKIMYKNNINFISFIIKYNYTNFH